MIGDKGSGSSDVLVVVRGSGSDTGLTRKADVREEDGAHRLDRGTKSALWVRVRELSQDVHTWRILTPTWSYCKPRDLGAFRSTLMAQSTFDPPWTVHASPLGDTTRRRRA